MKMQGRKTRKMMLMIIMILGWILAARPEVIITGMLHGTLPGGAPKAIELFIAGAENLSDYEIWRSTNGGIFGSGSGSIASLTGNYSNTFVYLVKSDQVGAFTNIWGNAGIFANVISLGILTGNGNDGFQIRRKTGSVVIDQVWEENATDSYRDSYWYRRHGTGPDGSWVISSWETPGNDALDGLDAEGHRAAVPFGTYAVAWRGVTVDWNAGDNWSSENTPSFQTNVVIADTASNFPEVDNLPESPAECMDLTLLGNAMLTVNPGKALTVHRNLVLQEQISRPPDFGLILQSEAGPLATGSLKVIGSASGIASIQKYLPKDISWRFISSPVREQSIRPEFAPEFPDQSFDFYSWDEASPEDQAWINIRDDNGSWNPSFEDSFTVAKGYLVAYAPSNNGDEIRDFSGEINHGNLDIPVYHSGNYWNLMGNPYTCALDWSSGGISKENIAGSAMYIWDPSLNNSLGGYRAHNGNTGVPAGSLPIIPAMQGFFVQSLNEGSVNVNLEQDQPLVHHSLLYLKPGGFEGDHVRLNVKKGSFSDETLICFNSEGTSQYDPDLDAIKLFSGHHESPEVYSCAGTEHRVCINMTGALPVSVPVGITYLTEAILTISASGLEHMEPWTGIYLEDRLEGNWFNLREGDYSFLHDPYQATERFSLHLENAAYQGETGPGHRLICSYSDGKIYLLYPVNQSGMISVFMMDGRKARDYQILPGNQFFEATLAKGAYLVRICAGGKMSGQVIIVN